MYTPFNPNLLTPKNEVRGSLGFWSQHLTNFKFVGFYSSYLFKNLILPTYFIYSGWNLKYLAKFKKGICELLFIPQAGKVEGSPLLILKGSMAKNLKL
jgi:hypothetical protein